ncbi:MAG: flagellar biosynthetic protein FliO [Cellulomonas sp.]|jgi:flagellar protein FliO/FliZ|nr:flagellar biosynthetic protein FliO [Cellulomonas sp.]
MDVVWLLLRAIVALGAVLGLIWWGARRMTHHRVARSGFEPHVMVVDRHALNRTAGVAVLAVGNRRLLVGYGDQQVGLLTELAPVVAPLEPTGTDLVPAPRGQSDKARKTSGKTSGDGERRSPLAGSVLHPQTWKDTWRALQDRTVRR